MEKYLSLSVLLGIQTWVVQFKPGCSEMQKIVESGTSWPNVSEQIEN